MWKQIIIEQLAYLDVSDTADVLAHLILTAGLTPGIRVECPPPTEDIPWANCWRRGLERIER